MEKENKKQGVRTLVYLPEDLKRELKSELAREGRSLSSFVRWAAREYLKTQNAKHERSQLSRPPLKS